MKTARHKSAVATPRLLSPEQLDARILGLIARSVERRCPDAEFNHLALALFRHQFTRNAPYRRYCESLGRSPRNVAHWKQIPAVPTTAFKDAKLTTLRPAERTAVFHSSGTTEREGRGPKAEGRSSYSRHFHSHWTLALYEAALWPMFEARVLESGPAVPDGHQGGPRVSRGDQLMIGRAGRPAHSDAVRDARPTVIILTPTPFEAPHSSLVHMMETIRRRLGAPESALVGAAALEDGRALAKAVQSKIQNPKSKILLLGAAFAFVRLLDAVKSLPLPPGSRVMETGGYKGRSREIPRDELHAMVSAKLGIPRSAIVSEYGMCEMSSQFYAAPQSAFRNPHSAIFHGPPWTRAQVINPETGGEARDGERGLIRIFDLANRASVTAIQTEDIGVRRGDGFELIGRAPQAEARGCSLMVAS